MPTYYLEYRGTMEDSDTLGDKRTLAAWGFTALPQLEQVNWARADLILEAAGTSAFLADIAWAFEDKIVLWRDTVRIWHGWYMGPARRQTRNAQLQALRFADPWYWLGRAPAKHPTISAQSTEEVTYTDSDGNDYTVTVTSGCTWSTSLGDVVWSGTAGILQQAPYTSSGQIYRALYAAIDWGAPLGVGTITFANRAPVADLKNLTCLSWVQSAARYAPLSAAYWDMSGITPALHATARASLTASTYALTTDDQTRDIEPLHELQVKGVKIRYWWGDNPGEYITDTAGDTTAGSGLLELDADVDDYQAAVVADAAAVAASLYATLSTLAWRGSLTIAQVDHALPVLTPGYALNLTGGRSEWASMGGVVQRTVLQLLPAATLLTVEWGAPRQLNVSDWLDIARIGTSAATVASSVDNSTEDDTDDSTDGGTFGDDFDPSTLFPAGSGVTITCKRRGGTAVKIGVDEYVATADPQRYLIETYSGGHTYVGYTALNGGIPNGWTGEYTQGGATSYDAATGAVTQTGWYTSTHVCEGVLDHTNTGAVTGHPIAADAGCTLSLASTVATMTGTGVVAAVANETYSLISGADVYTLSIPDSDDDAIARLVATLDEWGEVTATSGSAATAIRGPDALSIEYYEAQLIVTGTGYYAGWEYSVKVTFGRREAGSADAYTTLSTETVNGVADSSGEWSATVDVPNAEGYETCVLSIGSVTSAAL